MIYKNMRILLKISWESLKGNREFGIDPEAAKNIAQTIKQVQDAGAEIAIVTGWGNIYRGSDLMAAGMPPSDSHNFSMLGTVINWGALKNFLEQAWLSAVTMNALDIKFDEKYNKTIAKKYLEDGNIVICTGGTWNPYFSTDTGWALRALELDCDMMIKATKVDGIYDSDPMNNPDAVKFDTISYKEVLDKELKILDATAVSIASENSLPIKVVNMNKPDDIIAAMKWEAVGSTIQ